MKHLLLATLFLLNISAFAQINCGHFKTGTFGYTDPYFKDTVITRTETTQTESDLRTGLIISGTIEWISDCTYILTCTAINDEMYDGMIGQKFTNTITISDEEKYTCISASEGYEMEMEFISIAPQ